MILGVDHIALSVENIVDGVKLLDKFGLRAKFVQEGVPNHPAKRDFLKCYEPLHSIAYCQSEGSVSVELTQHSQPLCDALSPYQVLLKRGLSDTVAFIGDLSSWGKAWRASLGCIQPVAALSSLFHAQFWYDKRCDDLSSGFIRALLVPVTDLSVSEKFWVRGLGFRVANHGSISGGRDWMHITFRGPVQAWSLSLVLVDGSEAQPPHYLDDSGFPCLALISSRLNKDRELALEMGSRGASSEFCLVVADNPLQIALLRGPDNELVELIGFSPK